MGRWAAVEAGLVQGGDEGSQVAGEAFGIGCFALDQDLALQPPVYGPLPRVALGGLAQRDDLRDRDWH